MNSSIVNTDEHHNVPWISNLFLVLTVSKVSLSLVSSVAIALSNLATITFLGGERVKFGIYFMWLHIGTGALIVISALLAWAVRIKICGHSMYGYSASFPVSAFFLLMSMLSFPMFKFEYETDRVITWKEFKSVAFTGHYIYMFVLTFYLGHCVAFQIFWEFWYLDGLGGGPFILGAAALIRRSLLAAIMFLSTHVMRRIGDLNTICIVFLLLTAAFFCLSFTRVYWYVLGIDLLHSAAYGLGYSAFTVHFSKAGSKASSGVIFGKFVMQKYSNLTIRLIYTSQ